MSERSEISAIYICSRSSLGVPFSPYTPEAPLKIILKKYGYPGILMFAGVRIFKVSTRMCTIKNKMAEGFLETKIFRNAHTDTRAQQ